MAIEILPFAETMLPAAGRLLAARHARNRRALPLLPGRFAEAAVAEEAVRALWQKPLKQGFAALREGRLIAYLLGEYVVNPWARSGYVYLAGYALAANEAPAILQDLYARLGDAWVARGVFSHALYLSAADEALLDAFFDIGFGKERSDGLLDLRTLAVPAPDELPGITLRPAGPGDAEQLASVSHLIMDALAEAPYWHPTFPERYAELREGWAELAAEEEWTVWLALEGDRALGAIAFKPEAADAEHLLAGPRTIALEVGATRPEARGRGIAYALTWRGLARAQEEGYERCYCAWISSNLLAARYWPRFGFQEAAYRLAKQVNPMITWTRR